MAASTGNATVAIIEPVQAHAPAPIPYSATNSQMNRTVAFTNGHEGGTLLIGVADDCTIDGLDSDYASRSKKDQDPRSDL